MDTETFFRRLEKKMAERELTPEALSKLISRHRGYIGQLTRDRRALPTLETAATLAAALDCRVSWLIGEDDEAQSPENDDRAEPVRVVGLISATTFRYALELPDDEQRTIRLLPDTRYPRVTRAALRVSGPSMNLIAPDGAVVVFASFADLGARFGRAPRHGDIVVAEQWHHDVVAATCKELVERADGSWWLEPRSTDKTIKPIPIPRANPDERYAINGDDIKIHGLVTEIHQYR